MRIVKIFECGCDQGMCAGLDLYGRRTRKVAIMPRMNNDVRIMGVKIEHMPMLMLDFIEKP